MIIIWGDEGPLRYVGLVLFAVQALQIMPLAIEALSTTTFVLIFLGAAATLGVLYNRPARRLFSDWAYRMRRLFPQNTYFWVMFGFLATWILVVGILLLVPENVSIMPVLFQLVFLGLILKSFWRIHGMENENEQEEREVERQQSKLSEIVLVIQAMPIEEFVPDEAMNEKCTSISQLKQMLLIRGGNPQVYVDERQELVYAIQSCRNYCDTCCICCEEYQEGDPLRILPKCRHEFHVECLDQWAYSFANQQKRKRDPTCPLCNQAL